jgi:hypothetical protein
MVMPNLKQSFRLHREGDTLRHDLRNRATDLALPKPKRDFGKRSFKYNGAIIGIIYLLKQKMQIPLTHLKGF